MFNCTALTQRRFTLNPYTATRSTPPSLLNGGAVSANREPTFKVTKLRQLHCLSIFHACNSQQRSSQSPVRILQLLSIATVISVWTVEPAVSRSFSVVYDTQQNVDIWATWWWVGLHSIGKLCLLCCISRTIRACHVSMKIVIKATPTLVGESHSRKTT